MDSLESTVNVYHVIKTEFTKGKGVNEFKYFAVAPKGELLEISPSDFGIEGTKIFEYNGEVPRSLATYLVEKEDPPQIYKLPKDMPARSSKLNGGTITEYQRRGLSPKERDALCGMIRKELMDN